jgi:hypothetical protein
MQRKRSLLQALAVVAMGTAALLTRAGPASATSFEECFICGTNCYGYIQACLEICGFGNPGPCTYPVPCQGIDGLLYWARAECLQS